MKVLVIVALLVACANGSVVSKISEKFIPRFVTGYFFGGKDAKQGSAPYIVSLSADANNISHICGGTIISKDWILTAADCVINPIGMGVAAGLYDRIHDSGFLLQNRVVDAGRVHDKYSSRNGTNDIALLHVSEPFNFNEWVQPAILPSREETNEGMVQLYGWGTSNILQTGLSKILEWNSCKAKNSFIIESNMCTYLDGKPIFSGNGVFGGPLVLEQKGVPSQLIGIILRSRAALSIIIHTRVSAYIDWIIQIQNAYYNFF